jgi:hypothetical protein
MPVTSPRLVAFKAGRDRLLRYVVNTLTATTAAVAVLVVAVAAIAMGIT